MGKPFKKEIEESFATIRWAAEQDTDYIYDCIFRDTSKPLFIVGSGGSLSACHFVESIYQNLGNIAKAITPLDLYYSRFALKEAKILFISSSGRNNDILFAFKMAIQNHASEIITICMRKNAPLTKLANSFSVSKGIEFDIPTKKDGFLATNSLTAFFTVFAKSSGHIISLDKAITVTSSFNTEINDFATKLKFDSAITVLYGGWSTAIAYDIESKFTEAALGSVLLADYRNFGHGRHHWFAKRKDNSAIIALITPEEKQIAEKTINLIPDDIPRLVISSDKKGVNSSIELLIQTYNLVNSVGEIFKIDPGRPGVPEFGSKLYHLRYSSFYKQFSNFKISPVEEFAITKKTNKSSSHQLDENELIFWRNKYSTFINRLGKTKFSSIVFDYDGTLCSYDGRFTGSLPEDITNELIKLLKAGIIIGIATGRGQSVRKDLRNSKIPKTYWKNIIIGYYNGSDIGLLNDDNCPNLEIESNNWISIIETDLKNLNLPYSGLEIKLRPHQLTIETSNASNWEIIKKMVQNIVMTSSDGELQLLESSHSIDVVVRKKSSKLNVVNKCIEMSGSENCLTIGDKGQWPGNDYELLSTTHSLSVDEVSAHPDSCWNLSSVGLKSTQATLSYLKRISVKKNYFNISL
ncbi:MAG TPA: HAD-IIB family hydrolase [Paludibacter sp.]